MKKPLKTISVFTTVYLLTACSTMTGQKAEPTVHAGKISTKQTVHDTIMRDNPIDATVGFGHHHGGFGWGINMGVNEILGLGKVRENITYSRYTVEITPSESIMVQDKGNFSIGDCVEVLDIPGNSDYPQVRAATTCK